MFICLKIEFTLDTPNKETHQFRINSIRLITVTTILYRTFDDTKYCHS